MLEILDPLGIAAGRTGTLAGVDCGLLAPAAQRVWHDPDPFTHTLDRSVQRQLWILLHGLGTSRCARSRNSFG